jgi:hypothetical protein
VLTQPGSTFLVKAVGDATDAAQRVRQWLQHGLPLAKSVCPGFDPQAGDVWKRCPFIPTQGYGEITVNLPWLSQRETKPILLEQLRP